MCRWYVVVPAAHDEDIEPSFMVETRDDHGQHVALLTGELDVDAIAAVRRYVDAALSDGSGDVVFDLDGVTFIDSSGLNALLLVQQEATEQGRRLRLQRVSAPVRRVIALTDRARQTGDASLLSEARDAISKLP